MERGCFVADHIIEVTGTVSDDVAGTGADRATARKMPGLG